VAFLAMMAYALLRAFSYTPLRRLNEDAVVHRARQQTELMESVRGIQAIRMANQEGERKARLVSATSHSVERGLQAQRLAMSISAGGTLIFAIQRIVLIWLGATLVLQARMSIGALMACVAYAEQFVRKGSGLVDSGIDIWMLSMHAERISDITMQHAENHREPGHVERPIDLDIRLENVSFRYADNEPWVLRNVTTEIPEGQAVAITGASGVGKSTLAKLILGLLEPTEGAVSIGGIDIRKLGLVAYRDLIGSVMQDDQLFAGSIADNICFFDERPDNERIQSAAKAASVHTEIVAMPMAYESLVGDMGSTLSGGQKQRILVARAIYRQPRIIVLDEATSHLDIENECSINRAILDMNATRIVLAHRKETIDAMDRVIRLRGGRKANAATDKSVSAEHVP
jgi:ATP-binding cassette, subfamily B, bacterial CvaB/MchF/RaxB